MVGRTLSHYEILSRIGEGGMGVVYKGRDLHLGRTVAIKVLNAERTADPERRRRFVQEAKAASSLNHPHIITIHDIGSDDGVDFIAMEFVDGQTMDQLIAAGRLTQSVALKYAVQTAEALAKAHAAGIIHRDIKPSNIMVTADGLVKVLDFGVAKLISTEAKGTDETTDTVQFEDRIRTTEGRVVGTMAYMSPEQAAGAPVDARSDIFSLGAVLYEMVTGVRAFSGNTSVSTLAALLNDDPRPPSQLSASVDRDFERIILRCLRKDPLKRSQMMADVAVELDELRTESGTKAVAVARPAERRPRALLLLGIVAVVVAAGVGARYLWKDAPLLLPAPTVDHLTSYPGDERSASLSPDGRQVAFSWNGPAEDNVDVYVKLLNAETPLRLTTDPANDGAPAWSPDGTRIAFVRQQEDGASLFVTPPIPGSEYKLIDFRPAATELRRMHMSWTPDGKWLVLGTIEAGVPALSLIPVNGGDTRGLLSNSGREGTYSYPAVSPSGRSLAYALCKGLGGLTTDVVPCDVYVTGLGEDFMPTGASRRLTHQDVSIQGIAWAHDEQSVIYGSAAGGRSSVSGHLWRVPVDSGQPERLELAGAGDFPSISRSADTIVYTRDSADYDILRFTGSDPPAAAFSSTTNDFDPQLSPDAKFVAFASDRSGRGREIWVATLSGTNARPVTQASGRELGSPRWSPDGRWLAFDGVSPGENWDIYVVEAAGGAPRRLTTDPGFENFPSWSRDGQWIYFRSTRSGRSEVWRMRPDGTLPVQVTRNGGASAWESIDGRTLYFTRHDGLGKVDSPPVFAMAANGGAERQVLDAIVRWDFAPTESGIYYVTRTQPRRQYMLELRFLQFQTGKSRVVSRFQARAAQGLSASRDGKIVLYSGIGPTANADLMLIQNFR